MVYKLGEKVFVRPGEPNYVLTGVIAGSPVYIPGIMVADLGEDAKLLWPVRLDKIIWAAGYEMSVRVLLVHEDNIDLINS